jgi:hypothetical protein
MLAVLDGAASVDGQRWIRCTQSQTLGCAWLVPDEQEAYRREKLVPTAAALRRLVHQLLDFGLPIEPFWHRDGGLAFDLLSRYSEGKKVTIGHANGVITIDLVESLDAYRESLRVRLGEPYRTMLGHFRHEVGHYYQNVLVETGSGAEKYLADCRTLFGDERISYADEIARHYKFGAPDGWAQTFISDYATTHPWEDFAESFRETSSHCSPTPTSRSNACCTTGDGCRCCSIASTPRWASSAVPGRHPRPCRRQARFRSSCDPETARTN